MKIIKQEIEGKCRKIIFEIEVKNGFGMPYLVCAEALNEAGYYWGKYGAETIAEAEERFSSSCGMWG
jgi:hypothetical protein